MYVGESQYGRVRWVLRCGEEPKPEPIKTSKPSPWWGISANYATGMSGDFMSYGLSLDMAFSVSESVALGGRIKLTMDNYQYLSSTYVSYTDYYGYYDGYWADSKDGDDGPGIWIGPEFKYTFPKNNAIIVGIGFAGLCSFNWETFYLQLGYKTKKSFYITVESLLAGDVTGVGVGLGFSFGGKRSK